MLTPRQYEIVEKSIEIIATKGIQGLTIKNLSKEIGISEPAIYRHFESKTDILLAILKNFEEMSSFMDGTIKESREPALEKIAFMFTKIIQIFSEQPSHISVVFSEEIFKNDEKLQNKIVDIMNGKVNTIADIIAEGQTKGEVRKDIDNKTLALIVVGSLRFMVKKWDLTRQYVNLQKEGEKLINGLTLILKE